MKLHPSLILTCALAAGCVLVTCSRLAGTSDETEFGVVAGVVRDRHGMGVHDALVTLHWHGEGERREVTARTYSDGAFLFEGVPGGTYFLETKDLYKNEGSLERLVVVPRRTVEQMVRIDTMGLIQGRLDTVVVRQRQISAVEVLEIRRNAAVHANGVFVLRNLPPFDEGYRLAAYSGLQKVASVLDTGYIPLSPGRIVSLTEPPDPDDDVLIAYRLSSFESAQFSHRDGKVSEFWKQWSNRDSIRMVPSRNTYAGRRAFNSEDDAAMTIKAAGDARGLYLYVETTDDQWLDVSQGQHSWIVDAVDLYFDPTPPSVIRERAHELCLVDVRGNRINSLTKSSLQMQVSMGGARPPEWFRLSAFSQLHQLWLSAFILFDDARINHDGLAFEVIQVNPTRKVQEWFIPWSVLGFEHEPTVGTRMAFSGGYNDVDREEFAQREDMVKSLRWRERDPHAPPDANGGFPEAWGAIEMGIGFPNE